MKSTPERSRLMPPRRASARRYPHRALIPAFALSIAIALVTAPGFLASAAAADAPSPPESSPREISGDEWFRLDAELTRAARRLVELGREKKSLGEEMRRIRDDYTPGDIGPGSVLARRRAGRLAERMDGLAREQGSERETIGRSLRAAHENRELLAETLRARREELATKAAAGGESGGRAEKEIRRADAWLRALAEPGGNDHERLAPFLREVLGEELAENVAREFRPSRSGPRPDRRPDRRADRPSASDGPPPPPHHRGAPRDAAHDPPFGPPGEPTGLTSPVHPPPPPPPDDEIDEAGPHRDRPSSWGSLRAEMARMRERIERLEREQLETRETIQRQQSKIDRLSRRLREIESPGEDRDATDAADTEATEPAPGP